jgi:hypothetical protein
MKTGVQKTVTVFFLVVLASLVLPATVYICLSPGTKKHSYSRSYHRLNDYSEEMNVVSKHAAQRAYEAEL